jgi:SAM-dependent methyltransferase
MSEHQIRFDDGAAYEQMMGKWSRLAGEIFLDWLAPLPGWRWIDIGCGNGAFTELIVERCAPSEVAALDPSPAQLAFARSRPAARLARFQQGDAMALSYADGSFDAAVMALVIFFIPDPAKGVAEMARVVCLGGTVATYAWDMLGGGLPHEPLHAEMRAMGVTPPRPPSSGASRMQALRDLWTGAGLDAIATKRSWYSEPLPVSMISGQPAYWGRASGRQLPRWLPATSNSSRHACARACRPTPQAASPTVRAQTR